MMISGFIEIAKRGGAAQMKYEIPDHYATLDVARDASQHDITAAYNSLEQLFRPSPRENSWAPIKRRALEAAFLVLGDVGQRSAYDQDLEWQAQKEPGELLVRDPLVHETPVAENKTSTEKTVRHGGQSPTANLGSDTRDDAWFTWKNEVQEYYVGDPATCRDCGTSMDYPVVRVFEQVVGRGFGQSVHVHVGPFCKDCSARVALKASAVSALFGWWGLPFAPLVTVRALVRNTLGGKKAPDVEEYAMQKSMFALAGQGRPKKAHALALKLEQAKDFDHRRHARMLRSDFDRRHIGITNLAAQQHQIGRGFIQVLMLCMLPAMGTMMAVHYDVPQKIASGPLLSWNSGLPSLESQVLALNSPGSSARGQSPLLPMVIASRIFPVSLTEPVEDLQIAGQVAKEETTSSSDWMQTKSELQLRAAPQSNDMALAMGDAGIDPVITGAITPGTSRSCPILPASGPLEINAYPFARTTSSAGGETTGNGNHVLTVQNTGNKHAIVRLRPVNGSPTALTLFIRAGETASLKNVTEGDYQLQYAQGTAFAFDCQSFVSTIARQLPVSIGFHKSLKDNAWKALTLALPRGSTFGDLQIDLAAFNAQ
ncbi:MAG: hypothetical protein JKY49_07400 [Cohaesibacteraceae bacterium]|nr:hypothetical protein [Cohaesibacteraceae bacterium]